MTNLQLLGTHFHQVGDLLLNWNIGERMPAGSTTPIGGGAVIGGSRSRGARGSRNRSRSRTRTRSTTSALPSGPSVASTNRARR